MSRVYDVPTIRFIGSGFYCTDNPKAVDDKTALRLMNNEYKGLQEEAYKNIEEEAEEEYSGFMIKDRHGKNQFVSESEARTSGNTVNIKGKTYRVAS
jgi:hypothetical protein